MNDLQESLLKMLHWFHDYCIEHDLTYYVLGGTLLGAVRHHGFIPWDDDVDIGMPRDDYERLMELLSSQEGNYLLETPYSFDNEFCFPFSKLYDTSTTLIENTSFHLVRGVYLDIFPLDGLGNSRLEAKLKYQIIQILLTVLSLKSIDNKKKRTWYKRLILSLTQSVLFSFIDTKKLCQLIDSVCKRNRICDKKYGGNLLGAWRYKEVVPLWVFGNPTFYPFEDMMVYGAEHYDYLLTSMYGNWKALPPKEKRMSHHDHYLDLNMPYTKYKEGD